MKLIPYTADRALNKIMAAVDLCPDYKVFAIRGDPVEIDREGDVPDEAFVLLAINHSKHAAGQFWIPAIEFDSHLYVAEGIKEISDGQRVMHV